MNYSKIYDDLIEKSRNRINTGYTERHHIIARCLGGSNSKSNITRLTPEEHYLAHLLLVKINPGNSKLIFAANMMTGKSNNSLRNNKSYSWVKSKLAKAQSENKIGKKLSKAHKDKIATTMTGKKFTQEHLDNIKKSAIAKNKEVARKLSKKVICIETGTVFDSITAAATFVNTNSGNISQCVHGKVRRCRGYTWRFAI